MTRPVIGEAIAGTTAETLLSDDGLLLLLLLLLWVVEGGGWFGGGGGATGDKAELLDDETELADHDLKIKLLKVVSLQVWYMMQKMDFQ